MSDPLFNKVRAGVKKVKEASVEDQVVKHAKSKGCFVAKVTFPGHRGAADRIFIYQKRTMFIEFKRPNRGKVSTLQLRFVGLMQKQGIDVWVVNNVDTGKLLIDDFVR